MEDKKQAEADRIVDDAHRLYLMNLLETKVRRLERIVYIEDRINSKLVTRSEQEEYSELKAALDKEHRLYRNRSNDPRIPT